MAETIPLLHGATIPRLGFGTSPMDDATTETAVATAIEAGYRLVDTAENYANERGVGRGIKASGVPREQLFVTTKFNKRWHGVELAAQALERSIDRLGLDYVDLLLIHWPNPRQDRYVQAWEGLVQLLEQGRVRAIGTSNFKPTHLDRIIEATGVVPDVNQIQLSPSVTRTAARWVGAAPTSCAIPSSPSWPSATDGPRRRSCCAGTSSSGWSPSRSPPTLTGSGRTSTSSTSPSRPKTSPRSPPWTGASRPRSIRTSSATEERKSRSAIR